MNKRMKQGRKIKSMKRDNSYFNHKLCYFLISFCMLHSIYDISAQALTYAANDASSDFVYENSLSNNEIYNNVEYANESQEYSYMDDENADDFYTDSYENDYEIESEKETSEVQQESDFADELAFVAESGDASEEDESQDDYFILNQNTIEEFDAIDPDSIALLEEIQNGETVGFCLMDNVDFDEGILLETETEELILDEEEIELEAEVLMSSLTDATYNLTNGSRIYCDEVWTKANDYLGGNQTRMSTYYRTITYKDVNGTSRTSPIYCMNAMKGGIPNGEIDEDGIRSVTNLNIRKLLYFGYGGPEDYCSKYDPTCTHIDWSNWHNRYVFTHQALSKTYMNDVGNATAAEIEHVGLNRFISKLTSLSLPTRNATLLNAVLPSGERVTGQSVTVSMPLYHGYSDYKNYMPSNYKNGYYLTEIVIISDEESSQNGITMKHNATSRWTVFYWNSYDDYVERGVNNPRVCTTDQTLTLKHSARFRIGIPASSLTPLEYTFSLIQNPVSYLWVDTSQIYGTDAYQDFGAVVYHGEKVKLKLVEKQSPQGNFILYKKDESTDLPVANAQYSLYAEENLVSAGRTVYKKDTLIDKKATDSNGKITFSALIPGKYYLKETIAPTGYQIDTELHHITVTENVTNTSTAAKTITVKDRPLQEPRGSITINKTIYTDELVWAHGNPTFQFCVEEEGRSGTRHVYHETIIFDEENCNMDADFCTMSVTIRDVPLGQYKITEYDTLRYYLEKIVANTSNTTVTQLHSADQMLRPDQIAYATANLTEQQKTASLTFYNKKAQQQKYSHTSLVKNYIPFQVSES